MYRRARAALLAAAAVLAAAAATAYEEPPVCLPCPPGEYRFLPCHADHRRICMPCPPNTFNSNFSLSDECEYCRNYCLRVNEIIVANCTSRANIVCHCRPGTWLRSEEDPVCLPHAKCSKGYGVKHEGSRSSDTVCEKCPPGFYSDTVSAVDRCRPLSECQDTGIQVPGGQVSDNLCHPAASFGHDKSLPDWAVAVIVICTVIAAIVAAFLTCLLMRRRSAVRRGGGATTSSKGCTVAQRCANDPREVRQPPPPPAYGEAVLNDLGAVQCRFTMAPLLVVRGNIEVDDINRNVMDDYEKLDYKTSRLPRDSGGCERGDDGRSRSDSGGVGEGRTTVSSSSDGAADVMREVLAELSRSLVPYYIPFFQILPEGFRPEELAAAEVTLGRHDQQGLVYQCLEAWYLRLSNPDLALEYIVQTLRHEAIGDHESAATAQYVFDEALRQRRRSRSTHSTGGGGASAT